MDVHRRIAIVQAGLLTVALAAAAVLSTDAQWNPLWLVVALAAFHLASDAVTMPLAAGRVSAHAVPLALTPVLTGPGPAAATTILVLLVDSVRSRPPLHAVMTNLAGTAAGAVIGGAIVTAYGGDRGTAEFGLVVLASGAAVYVVVAVNLYAAMSAAGASWRELWRTVALPMAPWEVAAVCLAAGIALLYEAYGPPMLAGSAVALGALALLLHGAITAVRRGHEIDRVRAERDLAEERERRRVAAELHDDALQTLLAARADLAEGLAGDPRALTAAHDELTEALGTLRRLMSGAPPTDPAATPVGAALEDLAIDVERRTGATASVEVDEALADERDGLLVAVARELLVNVAKHARPTVVGVRLERAPDGGVALEIADDGVGIAGIDRQARRHEGHLGLQLIEERVASRGGTFVLRPREGGGTLALVRLP
jgi:signal transduction histidine kinase